MERRLILKLIAAGVIVPQADVSAQHTHGLVSIAPAQAAAYTPQFFSQPQLEMVDRLTDIIVPTDEHSPGAHEAKVANFADILLSDSPVDVQKAWTAGLKLVDAEAQKQGKQPFLELSRPAQEKVVAKMAAHEGKPSNDLEHFFARLKRMTIDGYYTSRTGMLEELKYQGNTPLTTFPGCDHPEHQG
jgi:hypothetical protein